MHREPVIDEPTIADISRSLTDLENMIHEAKGLTTSLRRWFLELIRAMQSGVDHYRILGRKGLRQELYVLLAQVVDRNSEADEVEKAEPSLWSKFMEIAAKVRFVTAASDDMQHLTQMAGTVIARLTQQ